MELYFLLGTLTCNALFFAYCSYRNSPQDSLHESEKKIKLDWRKSLYIFYFCSFSTLTLVDTIAYFLNPEMKNQLLLEVDAFLLLPIFHLWPMYYFAFLKSGTKWLYYWIYFGPAIILARSIKDNITLFQDPNINLIGIAFSLCLELLNYSFLVYFWFPSKRLYDLNLRLKKQKKLVSARA